MPRLAQARGHHAEDYACAYLQQHGLTLLLRNFRCALGEIDLIMQDQTTLVFVEVRYRGNSAFGTSAESVNYAKQHKLIKAAYAYLQQHGHNDLACRFDVVALTLRQQHYTVEWLKNAFSA